ncbi:mediator of RNA polymerase II transcription subunit 22-like [Antedon mediterranea]|uniref:mediator of RNA polymerase II transcription subunit 22-like n=1 Tax=Antedon mediterranea TaxID=105859 RepID=UPI003AF6DA33
MAQAGQRSSIPQSKDHLLRSYNKRLKDDVRSMLENFTEIIKLAKVEEVGQVSQQTQGEQDHNEMQVRAANIVRAGESLMTLVADIKQFLILNDFPSVNEAITKRSRYLKGVQTDIDVKLIQLRDDLTKDLYDIEEEYYSSRYK